MSKTDCIIRDKSGDATLPITSYERATHTRARAVILEIDAAYHQIRTIQWKY